MNAKRIMVISELWVLLGEGRRSVMKRRRLKCLDNKLIVLCRNKHLIKEECSSDSGARNRGLSETGLGKVVRTR